MEMVCADVSLVLVPSLPPRGNQGELLGTLHARKRASLLFEATKNLWARWKISSFLARPRDTFNCELQDRPLMEFVTRPGPYGNIS